MWLLVIQCQCGLHGMGARSTHCLCVGGALTFFWPWSMHKVPGSKGLVVVTMENSCVDITIDHRCVMTIVLATLVQHIPLRAIQRHF